MVKIKEYLNKELKILRKLVFLVLKAKIYIFLYKFLVVNGKRGKKKEFECEKRWNLKYSQKKIFKF